MRAFQCPIWRTSSSSFLVNWPALRNAIEEQIRKAGPESPFGVWISVSRLPAIALSTGTTATAATESTAAPTGTLLHRFRFIDR